MRFWFENILSVPKFEIICIFLLLFYQIQVAHHDGSPVQDNVNPVVVSYGAGWDDSNHTSEKYNLDSNGMVSITLSVTDDNGISVNVSIHLRNLS